MRLIVTFAVLVAAWPATAQDKPVKSKADPERVICRTDTAIGSRLQTVKTCMTARQWSNYSHDRREQIEKFQRFQYKGG